MEPVYLFGIFLACAAFLWVRATRGIKKAKLAPPSTDLMDTAERLQSARVELDRLRTSVNDLETQLLSANRIMQAMAPGAALLAILDTGSVEDGEVACPGVSAIYPKIMGDPQLRELLVGLLPVRRQRLIAELSDNVHELTSVACNDFTKSVARYGQETEQVSPAEPVTDRDPPKRQWG